MSDEEHDQHLMTDHVKFSAAETVVLGERAGKALLSLTVLLELCNATTTDHQKIVNAIAEFMHYSEQVEDVLEVKAKEIFMLAAVGKLHPEDD